MREYAATVKRYGCVSVTGDRYAGAWPREWFAMHGVRYEPPGQTKSELYGALLPLVNAQRVELLDERGACSRSSCWRSLSSA